VIIKFVLYTIAASLFTTGFLSVIFDVPLTFALAGSAIFAMLSFIIASKMFMVPLEKFAIVSHELEHGDYKARVSWGSDDEIGDLSRIFDRAIARLERVERERLQLDHAKTEFMSITSHELRSPMTPMKAQLEMLLAGYFGKLGAKQKESLELVLRNTNRLDRIILDLLEISRIEAARLRFNFERTSIAKVVQAVADEMHGFMPGKKVKLEVHVQKIPEIQADAARVSQVLRNLVNNAIKFSKKGGKVIVSARAEKNEIVFSVQDFGAGIGKQSQLRIFEPFFQEQSVFSRSFGGTGLGLAICRGIVEAQNGRIWFESEQGKGTAFHFTLPLTPVTELKPINILFSKKSGIESTLKGIFVEHLGPMGGGEFEALRKKGETDYVHIHMLLKELEQKGVIDNLARNTMDMEVLAAFGVGKKEGEPAPDKPT